jgi:NAD(P)-dependent dehydrogenase (short-subunit alcohol dehydrogenase family)
MQMSMTRIAALTAASSGSGRAIAKRLSADGYTVVVNYLRQKQLGELGTTFNAIAPGPIDTDTNVDRIRQRDARDWTAAQTALQRIGEAKDVANVVALMCSNAAQWITAQRVETSGGIHG